MKALSGYKREWREEDHTKDGWKSNFLVKILVIFLPLGVTTLIIKTFAHTREKGRTEFVKKERSIYVY